MECMRNQFTQGALLDGRYKTVCPLNHGSFGLVFKAQDVRTGQDVALKCLHKPNAAAAYPGISINDDDLSQEVAIHQLLSPAPQAPTHPGIVNLLNCFETENHIYLVLEYCPNGDLYEAIKNGVSPRETERVREAILQLIDAVEYIHSRGVYHRDIKPENIFLTDDRRLKLGDFGLATQDLISFERAVGSDRYMSPEQMSPPAHGYDSAKADVWAVGICILNILFSRNPFTSPTIHDPLYNDFVMDRQALFDIFPSMSQDTYDILLHCLAINPDYRSLAAAKVAVEKAIYFTTENETLDEFGDVAQPPMTTANREPLRTPSVSSPQLDATGAFPWARPTNNLSAIVDADHDMYQGYQPWAAPLAGIFDSSSVMSCGDSGLGVSLQSSNFENGCHNKTQPLNFAPTTKPIKMLAKSAPNQAFARKSQTVSKSWSQIFQDDDDEDALSEVDFDDHDSTFSSIVDLPSTDTAGSDTPRPALAEMTDTLNSRLATPVQRRDKDDCDPTLFEMDGVDGVPMQPAFGSSSGLSKLFSPYKRKALDKWTELGDKRRQYNTPVKARAGAEEFDTSSAPYSKEIAVPQSDSKVTTTWRKGADMTSYTAPAKYQKSSNWNFWSKGQTTWTPVKPVIMKKEWNMSQDWRRRMIAPGMADDRLVF